MRYSGNLLSLKTDLRSLKFSSEAPLIQKSIGNGIGDGVGKGLGKGLELEVKRRLDDTARITKVFNTLGGMKFVAKQGLLNLAENEGSTLGETVKKSLLSMPATIATILGQTAVAGTGVYLSITDLTGGKYLENLPILDNRASTTQNDNFDEILPGTGTRIKSVLRSKSSRFKRNIKIDGSPEEGYSTQSSRAYLKDSKEIRLGLGINKHRIGSTDPFSFVDKLNYLDVTTESLEQLGLQDIIPFKIEVFSPDSSVPYILYFRAYLESLRDNFEGKWNGTEYVGRAEEVYNYTGFKRNIGFSFKIAATSDVELVPLYKKLNRLVGTTAPSYSNTFMRGVFVKLTIGDYLMEVPGFFTNVDLTWDNSYPWEISDGRAGFRDTGTENDRVPPLLPRVPHVLDVSVNFTPVHSFNPNNFSAFIGDEELLSRSFTPAYVVSWRSEKRGSNSIETPPSSTSPSPSTSQNYFDRLELDKISKPPFNTEYLIRNTTGVFPTT